MPAKKPGLYANIQKKKARIAKGSGEKMRKPGSKGAPTAKSFRQSAKTAKKPAPSAKSKATKSAKTSKAKTAKTSRAKTTKSAPKKAARK